MRILYRGWNPRAEALDAITQAEEICAAYAGQGYNLTVRQLYYQFVAKDLFPDSRKWKWTGSRWVHDDNGTKNAEPNYKWICEVVDRARMAGMLSWNYIEDRTRNLMGTSHWTSPSDIINSAARSFRIDKWVDQPRRVEVWVEKEALSDVVGRVARRYDVDYFSCRGYVSQSEMWSAGQRLKSYIADCDQDVVILHLGDHDPSGLDMTRDIRDRLTTFIGHQAWNSLEVRRIALNYDQVQQYNPPPNPAKLTDPRATAYMDLHGDSSWELDALDPNTISALITENIEEIRDEYLYSIQEQAENRHRDLLTDTASRWDEVVEWLEEN